jgi:SH3 domain protein
MLLHPPTKIQMRIYLPLRWLAKRRVNMTVVFLFGFMAFCLSAPLSYAYAQAQTQAQPEENKGELRYISDELFIFMHTGPGRDFRIVGSITAGTTVYLLDVDKVAAYAQIEDERGRIGWVESKFVSRIPSIRAEIDEAKARLEGQQLEVNAAVAKMKFAQASLSQAEQQKQQLNRQLTIALEQKAELERSIEQRASKEQMQWFTRGTWLALVSVFFGFVLGFFARKRSTTNPLL